MRDVKAMKQKIKKANNFRYTTQVNQAQLLERRRMGAVVATIEELAKARHLLEAAREAGAPAHEVRDYEERVEAITAAIEAQRRKAVAASRDANLVDRLNRKNRTMNAVQDSALPSTQQTHQAQRSTAASSVKDVLDPFSRRPTRPMAMTAAKKQDAESDKAAADTPENVSGVVENGRGDVEGKTDSAATLDGTLANVRKYHQMFDQSRSSATSTVSELWEKVKSGELTLRGSKDDMEGSKPAHRLVDFIRPKCVGAQSWTMVSAETGKPRSGKDSDVQFLSVNEYIETLNSLHSKMDAA